MQVRFENVMSLYNAVICICAMIFLSIKSIDHILRKTTTVTKRDGTPMEMEIPILRNTASKSIEWYTSKDMYNTVISITTSSIVCYGLIALWLIVTNNFNSRFTYVLSFFTSILHIIDVFIYVIHCINLEIKGKLSRGITIPWTACLILYFRNPLYYTIYRLIISLVVYLEYCHT